jgi:hypothetical protein
MTPRCELLMRCLLLELRLHGMRLERNYWRALAHARLAQLQRRAAWRKAHRHERIR